MNYDVFLSHNSKDKPSVEEIGRKLQETYSLKCWLDKWNLVPGEPWQEALDDCQTVAVFVGPNIISPWENEEMRSAGEITFGLDDPKVTTSIQNLGLGLKDMGNYGEAKDVFKRILKINEKAFGLNHPNVGTSINNLGLVLEVLGDHIGAKNAYNRAIRIGKTTFGPDHL